MHDNRLAARPLGFAGIVPGRPGLERLMVYAYNGRAAVVAEGGQVKNRCRRA